MNPYKLTIAAIAGFALATSLSFASLSDLHWANAYPNEIREDLLTIEYDGEKFIAGGSGGAIWYSDNGISWQPGSITGDQPIIAKSNVGHIRYTGGTYFAFGSSSASAGIVQMTSDDGIRWSAESQSSGVRDTDIVYAFGKYSKAENAFGSRSIDFGNDTLVRMTKNYVIWTSADGVTWNAVDSTFAPDHHILRFLNGHFYTVTRKGQIYRASDGSTWELILDDASQRLEDIAYFKGKLYVIHPERDLLRSVDGYNWESAPAFYGITEMLALAASDREMVAVGRNGSILRSTDGETWNGIRSEPALRHFASNGTVLVGLKTHNDSWYSKDGYTLFQIDFNQERLFTKVATFMGGFIAYDYLNEELVTSADGEQWVATAETPQQLKDGNRWYIVNGRMFVISDFSIPLPVATTTDGSNWSYFEDLGFNHIYYGNGGYHASEFNGDNVYTSPDGLNWTKRLSRDEQQNGFHPNFAVYFKDAFYAGSDSRIYKSPNGLNWTILVDDDAFPYHTLGSMLTVWHDHLVYAGTNGTLSISSNGIEWTHFEVGASSPVEQILQVGNDIVLDLGLSGLIQSRELGGEEVQANDDLLLSFPNRSVEAKIGKSVYPERQYGALMQSDDLRKWTLVADAETVDDADFRRFNANFELGESGSAFFRIGYLSARDLFGSWVGKERIEIDTCDGASASIISKQYFVEIRRSENEAISIELLDTDDLSPIAALDGTFYPYGTFALTVTQSADSAIHGLQFDARIGLQNGAPLISLASTRANQDGCATHHVISLTR